MGCMTFIFKEAFYFRWSCKCPTTPLQQNRHIMGCFAGDLNSNFHNTGWNKAGDRKCQTISGQGSSSIHRKAERSSPSGERRPSQLSWLHSYHRLNLKK